MYLLTHLLTHTHTHTHTHTLSPRPLTNFSHRLRHNVIKTGIRMISLSYSRISLADIAEKLSLESTQDAEYIVAKAIKDGVIEAVINHEEGYVQSRVSGVCVCVHTSAHMHAFHLVCDICVISILY